MLRYGNFYFCFFGIFLGTTICKMRQKRECILKFSSQHYRFLLFGLQEFRKIYVHSYKYGGCEWGACLASGLCLNSLFPGFTRGATFRHIFVYILMTVQHINLNWMRIIRRLFSNSQKWFLWSWVKKIASVKKTIFPPLEIMYHLIGSCAD